MLNTLLMLADSGVQVDWGPWHSLICSVGAVVLMFGMFLAAFRGRNLSFNDRPAPPPADDTDNK